ncbi:rhomboid family intramembrane serine protease [Epilithonimonas arachidiradicis]|uniref:Membrane associated rhomboid family serine protease n=1 Tax=Epilithonimonas arachidiradicis TaxID=1617282 RepID=A0A420DDB1_9FLAO|nr:rhomboid family intramembrane serine protease [Epilithonimonas arachidiradicis]RKE89871.1 membrane associated rhomboid family serine protease [Epilithonimonas arachidiradicis]GGG45948.1 rhomboid family intramembrane serine protease [Epilithonimonas arachidiradicis]
MFSQLTPVTKNIIIINVIFFVGAFLLGNANINVDALLAGYFPLSPNFRSWQIITHMFMHGSILHIAFNMMTLWSFGPVLEQVLGQKKFIILYFASGLGGFLLYNIWNYVEVMQISNILISQGFDIHEVYKTIDTSYVRYYPNFSSNPSINIEAQNLYGILKTPMVGASGAIFGVIAAFSTLFPEAKLMFMFIPFPIKAKYLTPIIIVVSIFLGFRQFSGDNIAHFAHLGGALIGFLYIWNWKKNRDRIQ